MSFMFVLVPLILPSPLKALWTDPHGGHIIGGPVLQLRNTKLRKSISLIVIGAKQTCALSWMVTMLHPFRFLTKDKVLIMSSVKSVQGFEFLEHLMKMCRDFQMVYLSG
jgi:hypothetical protein